MSEYDANIAFITLSAHQSERGSHFEIAFYIDL